MNQRLAIRPVRPLNQIPHLRLDTKQLQYRKMSSDFRQRSVVSSFICTSPQTPGGLKFALFKRSQDVSTYRGKWAACSGSIDPKDSSHLSAAVREISEETKLLTKDLTLLRRGKPFTLTDSSLRTEWTIYPFLWQLKDNSNESRISLDFEHTEYRFIRPEELSSYDHVPQLEVGMTRVLVSPETEAGIKVLRGDKESGARALALKAVQILLDTVRGSEMQRLQFSTSVQFWREVRIRAWHLAKNGRPSMSAAVEAKLFGALDIVSRELQALGADGLEEIPLAKLKGMVDSVLEENITGGNQNHGLETIANAFKEYVERTAKGNSQNDQNPGTLLKSTPIKIITLSSSGTTHACLTTLVSAFSSSQTPPLKLIIAFLESRPTFEGASAATSLLNTLSTTSTPNHHVDIEIISDASIATAAIDADFILLGGDKVLPNGNVSNKIGSCALAVTAKALNAGCKVVAVFETGKITAGVEQEEGEENDEAEITRSWPDEVVARLKKIRKGGVSNRDGEERVKVNVKVRNNYFEWVPARFIDMYITERGVLSREKIRRLGLEAAKLEERVFGDL
ncbi:hypothetical protein ONS95_009705 [Cadophora gregata]|uniref:uncharacterized protein n=1 Tax=Cadophora gregata TaxID=51156 RepID=UPI0026DC9A09|nr:uncharacterized protein ONS95_009705 [Cadophora gregata]KAK0121411.1 hypothetical protein ONS95_009705 [Cadophora gregata]KAK0126881.1 hypothetical protein ONS96_006446 [Cadophora gregata f. sp. sojae]